MNNTPDRSVYKTVSHRSGSSLFLLELIIAVGFFAVAGVACINMFLHAHRVSTAAREKTEAVRITQNCAECFIASDGDESELYTLLQKAFPDASVRKGKDSASIELLFEEGGYLAVLSTEHADHSESSNTLHISVSKGSSEEIFRLDVSDYPQKGEPG